MSQDFKLLVLALLLESRELSDDSQLHAWDSHWRQCGRKEEGKKGVGNKDNKPFHLFKS